MANVFWKSFLLSAIVLTIFHGVNASDERTYSFKDIFKLRFIFDEQDEKNSDYSVKTSVLLLQNPKKEPFKITHDHHNALFPGDEGYNTTQYRLPDSTLTFCFIIVTFYLLYFSLRMFTKPDVEATETDLDEEVLHQLLITRHLVDSSIPDKLRSLYDDSDTGDTDLAKVHLIIDHVQLPDADDAMEKPPGYEEIVEMLDGTDPPPHPEDAADPPPPYSQLSGEPREQPEEMSNNSKGVTI